jgi:two-component system nitrate/nitrite response regulator NarL
MPSNVIVRARVPEKSRSAEPRFRAVIVDRDFMSSSLLADALGRDIVCDAVAIRSSNLLQALGARSTDIVAVSADLDGRPGVGFELAAAVSCAYPNIPIVMLFDKPCQKSVLKAFRSGARGLFCRQQSMMEFLDCVEHVRKGFVWAAGDEAGFLLSAIKRIPAPIDLTEGDAALLTTRESQVVRLAATGKTNKTIASEMALSEHTVKNYLFRAFAKLGVSSRVELLFYLTTSRTLLVKPSTAEHRSALDLEAI